MKGDPFVSDPGAALGGAAVPQNDAAMPDVGKIDPVPSDIAPGDEFVTDFFGDEPGVTEVVSADVINASVFSSGATVSDLVTGQPLVSDVVKGYPLAADVFSDSAPEPPLPSGEFVKNVEASDMRPPVMDFPSEAAAV